MRSLMGLRRPALVVAAALLFTTAQAFVTPTAMRSAAGITRLSVSHGQGDDSSEPTSGLSRRGLVEKALWAQAALVGGLSWGLQGAGAAEDPKKAPTKKKVKVKTTENGVKYVDIAVGEGVSPERGDFVIINYAGYLSDGRAFDSIHMKGKKNFAFRIGSNQVIPGLEEAIKTMKPGGERQLLIPPELGYGSKGVCLEEGGECLVPPNETLKYDVILKRVALSPLP